MKNGWKTTTSKSSPSENRLQISLSSATIRCSMYESTMLWPWKRDADVRNVENVLDAIAIKTGPVAGKDIFTLNMQNSDDLFLFAYCKKKPHAAKK